MIEDGKKGRLIDAWEGILVPLIEDKDIENLTLWNPTLKIVKCDLIESNGDIIKRYYRLFERIAVVLDAGKSDANVRRVLKNARDAQAFIREYRPDLGYVQKPPDFSVTILRDTHERNRWHGSYFREELLAARLQENLLWVARIGQRRSWKVPVELALMDLAKKELVETWQTEAPSRTGIAYLTGMTVHEDMVYLSISRAGIVRLPRTSGESSGQPQGSDVLTQEDGLPSTSITSIAREGNKLWVAYGGKSQESGLGLYDPRTGNWEMVLCSSLNTDAPFNAGLPYRLQNLTLVAPDRLFFVINDIELSRHTVIDDWRGLWKLNVNSRALTYFRNREMATHFTDTLVARIGGKWWLWSRYGDSAIIEFDFDSEEMKSVGWDPYPGLDSYSNLLSTGALHGNRFWGRWGRSQIISIPWGGTMDDAHIVENNILDGHAVSRFMSTPYGLVAIGDGVVGLVEDGDE
jgi:hypothetical protein